MLEFAQDDNAAELILTLTELSTLPSPNYLFVFTHVITKDVVAFVPVDQSGYTQRYNRFTIDAAALFNGKQPGEWHYDIYEQESADNIDPSQAGAIVEFGKMLLDRPAAFVFEKYDLPTTYKTYNG